MSQIDSTLEPHLRALMLSEVRGLLPSFLSAASTERGGPVIAAIELLGLPKSELGRVLAVHMLLSHPVRALVAALPSGLRLPATSSSRPRVAGRIVTAAIDWSATISHRATSSPLGDIWVTRPASRVFDIPENRALAWVLTMLEERSIVAVSAVGEASDGWGNEIRAIAGIVHRARRTAWLEGIPSGWPGDEAYFRLKADRTGFYRVQVTEASRYLRRILLDPSPEDIVSALSERYFEPKQDWKLFEIAVLMRITQAMATVGMRTNPTRLFHDAGGRPFAVYRTSSTREVRIWYQAWPPATKPSELEDAIAYYQLHSGGSRPDIVVEIVDNGVSTRAIILELKASRAAKYLSSGLSQLLGYLRDRPRLFTAPASGWLVAPPNAGFASKAHRGRALWVTTADAVAGALTALI